MVERICTVISVFKCYFLSAVFWRVWNWFCVYLLFLPHNWQAWRRWVQNREWYDILNMWMFAWCLSLLSIPVALLSFIYTCEIWGDQVKCWSKRSPRYLTEVVWISFFPSTLVLKGIYFWIWSSKHNKFCFIFYNTLRVFFDHDSFYISCELSDRAMLVSSAMWYALEYFRHVWRSLMQMRNIRPDLWGTPDTISLIVETWLPTDTNYCLHFRYEQNQSLVSPQIP